MTCPTALAAVQPTPESLMAIDVRLVLPFSGLIESAPAPEVILDQLRDALESEGLGAFLDLCYETNSTVIEEIGDLQLFDGEAAS